MNFTYEYLRDNYRTLELMKSTASYSIELVLGSDRNTYIRRRITNNLAPYEELLGVASPYVAKTYYVAQQGRETLVLEEYVQGTTLQELLEQGQSFSEEQVGRMAEELSLGLEALHSKGIIHRDIKPSNIIWQENGQVKLIDFNAARLKKANRQHDTRILGTEGYAPPEQYGFMPTDERSDWYAMGKTLAELLGPEYRGKLIHVIEKCTRFDPQDRVKTAEEFRKLLKVGKPKPWLPMVLVALLVVAAGAYWFTKDNTVKEEPVAKVPEVKVEESLAPDNKLVEKQQKELTKVDISSNKSIESEIKVKNTETATESESKVERSNQAKTDWEARKKKIDATTPLRLLENKGIDLKALTPDNKYPRELACINHTPLQPIVVFQREKEFEQAFVVVEFIDFTMIPPKTENIPFLGRYKEYMTFMEQGDITLGVGINLSHFWKQTWKPYTYLGLILGTDAFKYYQLGPNPKIKVKLVFLDGQSIVKTAPVRIH